LSGIRAFELGLYPDDRSTEQNQKFFSEKSGLIMAAFLHAAALAVGFCV
jgi:hypothetical protein